MFTGSTIEFEVAPAETVEVGVTTSAANVMVGTAVAMSPRFITMVIGTLASTSSVLMLTSLISP